MSLSTTPPPNVQPMSSTTTFGYWPRNFCVGDYAFIKVIGIVQINRGRENHLLQIDSSGNKWVQTYGWKKPWYSITGGIVNDNNLELLKLDKSLFRLLGFKLKCNVNAPRKSYKYYWQHNSYKNIKVWTNEECTGFCLSSHKVTSEWDGWRSNVHDLQKHCRMTGNSLELSNSYRIDYDDFDLNLKYSIGSKIDIF